MSRLMAEPGLGIHRKPPVHRLSGPGHRFENYRWRTTRSSGGGTRARSGGLGVGHDFQLLARRPVSPANGGRSGQVSTRMVGGFLFHRTSILTRDLQLHTTRCEYAAAHSSSMATGGQCR